ncbi:tyrosine-type recombinase/integrase [Nitrospina watsonii]|uniref:Site-specific integrase n=1 Tax=Nitrospina watsonii TaxID=1323948 RepID=A0ABN8VX67_9BACT|nr:site-specific integrase [Nitrospina watsonii]CAI2717502.1 conserved protein of unknown function [Nitrospina watsonii]
MYKRGNVYWCKITIPGHKKPICKSLGKDKKLAKAIEAKIRAEIQEGKFFEKREGEYLTVAGLLEMYRHRYAKANKRPESLKTDGYLAKKLNGFLGEDLLPEVTPGRLEDYIAKRRDDGVSDVTIHHELNLLRHAFNLACKKWDLLDKNPFEKVTIPPGSKKRVRYLKPEEEKRLFAELDKRGDWLKSVVIIARETGLRLSNICNLTWDQVDLFKRAIEIEHTKNGNPVWIPLSDAVYQELKTLNKVRNLKIDRVFWIDGRGLHRGWVGLAFRRLCKRAKVENFRFHDLRHDFCSRLVQAGQPLQVVAELAGHTNITTTQRYAHLNPEMKRKAIEALNGNNASASG